MKRITLQPIFPDPLLILTPPLWTPARNFFFFPSGTRRRSRRLLVGSGEWERRRQARYSSSSKSFLFEYSGTGHIEGGINFGWKRSANLEVSHLGRGVGGGQTWSQMWHPQHQSRSRGPFEGSALPLFTTRQDYYNYHKLLPRTLVMYKSSTSTTC